MIIPGPALEEVGRRLPSFNKTERRPDAIQPGPHSRALPDSTTAVAFTCLGPRSKVVPHFLANAAMLGCHRWPASTAQGEPWVTVG